VTQYEQPSEELVSDGIRIGVVMQRMEENSLKQHLLLKAERLVRWADLRAELVSVRRAQQVLNASAVPMDVGALGKGGGKGKDATVTCHLCGKPGHMKKDCWHAAKGSGGKSSKGGSKGRGSGDKQAKDKSKVTCLKYNKTGHYARDCRSGVAALDRERASSPARAMEEALAGVFLSPITQEGGASEETQRANR
jgi:hypothetical protein